MTKKSKKKALKTGCRSPDAPRLTTFSINSSTALLAPKPDTDSDGEPIKKLTNSEKRCLARNKKKLMERIYYEENSKRFDYPIDLWFLIAKFIKPQQVSTFSAICRSSYLVCCSRQFWMNLYNRFVIDSKNLPKHLQHDGVDTHVGLKTRVVRAIFHVYKPLRDRLVSSAILNGLALDSVIKLSCQVVWWKQITTNKNRSLWVYYFKFCPKHMMGRTEDIFKLNDLLNYNTDHHCVIVRATTYSFLHMPHVHSMQLSNASLGISHDLKGHSLKLCFHDTILDVSSNNGTCVTIDPLFECQVLNWWHPEYPHPFDH